MIPDVQRNTTAQEAQRAQPTPRTQPKPPILAPLPARPQWHGWSTVLRAVGTVLAFGAGIAYGSVMPLEQTAPPAWVLILELTGFVLWAALAAILFRSWWAMLFVPAAFCAGGLITNPGIFLGGSYFVPGIGLIRWIFSGGIAAVGAATGTPIGKWIERRARP